MIATLLSVGSQPTLSQPAATNNGGTDQGANIEYFPKQILKTGVSLATLGLSPNTLQLSNSIELTPVLQRIQALRNQISNFTGPQTFESLIARQDLSEATQKATLIIQETDLDTDFAIAEIEAEHQVYEEILATFANDRDKTVARTNAASFISNGVLWAVAEALTIPSFKNAKFAIPSGVVGIPAGIVPSIASMWTLRQINGKRKLSEVEPNMLAKLFGYPTTTEIEYPQPVWTYLNQVPADDPKAKKRLDQLIDRWVADANMPAFSDKTSKRQLDVLTASVAQRKGLSIGTLTARTVMLRQLHAEILKMKRLLLELTMCLQGEKQLTVSEPSNLSPIGLR